MSERPRRMPLFLARTTSYGLKTQEDAILYQDTGKRTCPAKDAAATPNTIYHYIQGRVGNANDLPSQRDV